MTKEDLQALGLTPEDVVNKLIDRLVDSYVETEDGIRSDFESRIEETLKATLDARIQTALDTFIAPKVNELVDNICLQETNRWGEKTKAAPLTFTEYLVARVDAHITEQVNHNGKARSEDSYSWSAHSTRIAYMIHQHLQYNIEQAMKEALGEVNSSVRKGLEEAVKKALASVKVQVDTKVTT